MVRRPVFLATLVFLILFVSCWVWLGNFAPSLSDQEISEFEGRLQRLPSSTQVFLDQLNLNDFMRDDDGRAFHVVNLFVLNESASQGMNAFTGQDLLNQFSRSMLPLWLKHGGYPVFSMPLQGQFNKNGCDIVSVVRYRSRRDFMEIVVSDAYQQAIPQRLAATKTNLRIVSSGSEFPKPLFVLSLLFIAVLLSCYIVELRGYKKIHSKLITT